MIYTVQFTVPIECDLSSNIEIDSNLFFINSDMKQSFIPFELFLQKIDSEEYLYTIMLSSFLYKKENYEDIHLDLQNGYHIEKFYYLKNIFENSQWIDLIAFDLAQKINTIIVEVKEQNKKRKFQQKIILIGIEKYSSMILSVVQSILNTSLQIYIIENIKNNEVVKQFNDFSKENLNEMFVFFRPAVFEFGQNIKNERFLDRINNYKLLSAIKLQTKKFNSPDWQTLYLKDIEKEGIVYYRDDKPCPHCFPNFSKNKLDEPIYKIDDDKYNIKNLYKDQYISNNSNISTDINWKNSVYFGHTQRKTNHYLYYIKTIQFLKNNKNLIEDYFSKKTDIYSSEKIPIILSANHNTNSEFISLVNSVIFDNNAIVHSFSLDFKEQVFYSLDNFIKEYETNCKYYEFYFVDDEVSSGDTLEYFYNILKRITNTTNIVFNAVFTLIDRTSQKDKMNVLSKYYKNDRFYSFLRLNIHPIKTGFEECYLCKRKDYLEDISYRSSLIFIKNSFAKKAKGILSNKDSVAIEYKKINQMDDFKAYLKMYSTEYIYRNLKSFSSIDEELDIFVDIVKEYFEKVYFKSKPLTREVESIIIFEAKIAFLKSLSFPKILFFKDIRKKIHTYIYNELFEFIMNKDESVKEKENIIIQELLSEKDFETLSFMDEIAEITYYHKYKDRTDIDYFNFLLLTASYLGINFIMSKKMIEFYYKLTQNIKKEEDVEIYNRYRRLLGVYPIAIKQITFYSKEKSNYFHLELEEFFKKYQIQYTRQYSRIFGLYVENTKLLENNLKSLSQGLKKDKIDESLKILKENIENFIKDDKFGKYDENKINITNFYIDINKNKSNPKLIDILNDYKEVNQDSYELCMYKGASVVTSTFETEEIDITFDSKKDAYNIWCNFLKNEKSYVRLTDFLFNPLGVVVINHPGTSNLLVHLKVSRKVLAIQNEIIDIFKENEFVSSIGYIFDEITKNKHKIAKASHGAKDNLNMAIYSTFDTKNNILPDKLFYNVWVAYCNIKIGNMYLATKPIKKSIERTHSDKLELSRFRKYLNSLKDIYNVEIDDNIDDNVEILINSDSLEIFLTLLIESAIKHSSYPSKIEIFYINNMLRISNYPTKLDDIDFERINKFLTIEPHLISDKQGITLYTINKYLSLVNYSLSINFKNKLFVVSILNNNLGENQ